VCVCGKHLLTELYHGINRDSTLNMTRTGLESALLRLRILNLTWTFFVKPRTTFYFGSGFGPYLGFRQYLFQSKCVSRSPQTSHSPCEGDAASSRRYEPKLWFPFTSAIFPPRIWIRRRDREVATGGEKRHPSRPVCQEVQTKQELAECWTIDFATTPF
jgi:hypothetical protein